MAPDQPLDPNSSSSDPQRDPLSHGGRTEFSNWLFALQESAELRMLVRLSRALSEEPGGNDQENFFDDDLFSMPAPLAALHRNTSTFLDDLNSFSSSIHPIESGMSFAKRCGSEYFLAVELKASNGKSLLPSSLFGMTPDGTINCDPTFELCADPVLVVFKNSAQGEISLPFAHFSEEAAKQILENLRLRNNEIQAQRDTLAPEEVDARYTTYLSNLVRLTIAEDLKFSGDLRPDSRPLLQKLNIEELSQGIFEITADTKRNLSRRNAPDYVTHSFHFLVSFDNITGLFKTLRCRLGAKDILSAA